MKRTSLWMGLVLLSGAVSSFANVVTFDTFAPQDTCLPSISDGGLTFTGGTYCEGVWVGNPNGNGTPSLINGYSGDVTITATSGTPFNLNAFDMTISWYDGNPTEPISLTANYAGGGNSITNIIIDQGIQNYAVNLNGVNSVVVSPDPSGYWLMDNVDFSPTPEPASLIVLGTALAGIVGLRKRLIRRG